MRRLPACVLAGLLWASAFPSPCRAQRGHDPDAYPTPEIMKRVSQPVFRVALTKESIDSPELRKTIEAAVLTWIEPLRRLSPEPLAEKVEFVREGPGVRGPRGTSDDEGPDYAHADITLDIGPHASLSAPISGVELSVTGSLPGQGGDPVRLSDIVHELGHLFGLEDQYGLTGDFPESVMNAEDISSLTPHDLACLKATYKTFLRERQEESGEPVAGTRERGRTGSAGTSPAGSADPEQEEEEEEG